MDTYHPSSPNHDVAVAAIAIYNNYPLWTSKRVNAFSTTSTLTWGQTTFNLSGSSPNRGCSSKRVEGRLGIGHERDNCPYIYVQSSGMFCLYYYINTNSIHLVPQMVILLQYDPTTTFPRCVTLETWLKLGQVPKGSRKRSAYVRDTFNTRCPTPNSNPQDLL